jgi:hypothetical protein
LPVLQLSSLRLLTFDFRPSAISVLSVVVLLDSFALDTGMSTCSQRRPGVRLRVAAAPPRRTVVVSHRAGCDLDAGAVRRGWEGDLTKGSAYPSYPGWLAWRVSQTGAGGPRHRSVGASSRACRRSILVPYGGPLHPREAPCTLEAALHERLPSFPRRSAPCSESVLWLFTLVADIAFGDQMDGMGRALPGLGKPRLNQRSGIPCIIGTFRLRWACGPAGNGWRTGGEAGRRDRRSGCSPMRQGQSVGLGRCSSMVGRASRRCPPPV